MNLRKLIIGLFIIIFFIVANTSDSFAEQWEYCMFSTPTGGNVVQVWKYDGCGRKGRGKYIKEYLNILAADGWELVSTMHANAAYFYLKRPIKLQGAYDEHK